MKKILIVLMLSFLTFLGLKSLYRIQLREKVETLIYSNQAMRHYQGMTYDMTTLGPFIIFNLEREDDQEVHFLRLKSQKNLFERTLNNDSNLINRISLKISIRETQVTLITKLKLKKLIWLKILSISVVLVLCLLGWYIFSIFRGRKAIELSNLATQVAHDIRSPLEILKGLNEDIDSLPVDSRNRLRMSILRIDEITVQLLNQKRFSKIPKTSHSTEIKPLLKSILEEKRLEYNKLKTIRIIEDLDYGCDGLISKIDSTTLRRILSNIINNSVQAVTNLKGEIEIKLFKESKMLVIQVKDNGVGISEEVRKLIFNEGFTTKISGNGLGLSNASKEIKSIGGNIEIESKINQGTSVKIFLPFVENINQSQALLKSIVLIDDDKLVRLNWKNYSEKLNIAFQSFNSVEAFLKESYLYDKNTPVFIDSNLGNDLKGEFESQLIYKEGFKNLFLATGYDKNDITKPFWIRDIFSKDPSCIKCIEI